MRILVTNDDGILAPGIRRLVQVAKRHGTVKVAAPDRERSACSHSMTMREPLRVWPVNDYEGVEAYQVSGMPVDCVNLGLHLGWPDGCDLVLSGINNGPNLGFDITYSGTAAGAMEGVINGIPSLSISMALFENHDPVLYETATRWLDENWDLLESAPRRPLTFLNVNVPNVAWDDLKGTRVAKMGKRVYKDRIEYREDPWGRPYYWQGGAVIVTGDQPGTDVEAIVDGFVSVTPVSMDWTDNAMVKDLQEVLAPSTMS
jgi:5'-nucleotidase